MEDVQQKAENYAEQFRFTPEIKGWYQQKVDDFTAGYEAASNKLITCDEIKHLEWIYERMKNIHKEKQNVDYMLKFREILDKLKK